MRKITGKQLVVFFSLLTIILLLGFGLSFISIGSMPLGDLKGVLLFITSIFFIYCFAFAFYRLFLTFMPLKEGEIEHNSRDEFVYHIYLMFFLILFYPIMRGGFFPVPLGREQYDYWAVCFAYSPCN